jgi:hypothetical protein
MNLGKMVITPICSFCVRGVYTGVYVKCSTTCYFGDTMVAAACSVPRRPAAAPLVLLCGAAGTHFIPPVGGGAPISRVSRLSHFSTPTGHHASTVCSGKSNVRPVKIK